MQTDITGLFFTLFFFFYYDTIAQWEFWGFGFTWVSSVEREKRHPVALMKSALEQREY